jgi:hypothetical protein
MSGLLFGRKKSGFGALMQHKTDRLRGVKGEMLKRDCCHFVTPLHELTAVCKIYFNGVICRTTGERVSWLPFEIRRQCQCANPTGVCLESSAAQVCKNILKAGVHTLAGCAQSSPLDVHYGIKGSMRFFDGIFLLSMSWINVNALGEGSNILLICYCH